MRSTKASNAIERLKKRSDNALYSMTLSNGGLFCLVLKTAEGQSTRLCEPMPMENFVAFVNAFGPQIAKRVSKLEQEFSQQLAKKQ